MSGAALAFWLCVTLVAYAYVVFPAATILLARRRGRSPLVGDDTPPVTIVIAACNEATRIARRVDDLLAQDYPADRIAILVADDGSRDGTAEAARRDDPRVRVVRFDENRGKASTLSDAVATVTTPIVVLADARQRWDRDALRRLVAPFADPSVGAVTGELMIAPAGSGAGADGASESVGLYWKMEKALREAEARLGVLHGVTGAIYAIRRELWSPMPRGTILDDLWQPTHVLFVGQRVWMARDAIAYDAASDAPALEFRRKLRTLAGNWQLMRRLPAIANPARNPAFFAWFSHKFLRLLVPWALVGAVVASALASFDDGDGAWFYRFAFAAQLAFYAVAAFALARPHLAKRIPMSGTAAGFTLLNAAALLALPAALTDPNRLWRRH